MVIPPSHAPSSAADSEVDLQFGVLLSDEVEPLSSIRTSHKIRGTHHSSSPLFPSLTFHSLPLPSFPYFIPMLPSLSILAFSWLARPFLACPVTFTIYLLLQHSNRSALRHTCLNTYAHSCEHVLAPGFAFNPVCVTRNKKSDGSGSMGGDRALVSLINNTLETYHINSPDSLFTPALVASSSSSQKKAKKSKTSMKSGADKDESAEGVEEDAEEDDEEEEEKVDVVAELVQSSSGELVLKQAVLDLHGHR